MQTRFILENLAAAKLGYSLPPYIDAQFHQRRNAPIGKASDTQLLEIIAGQQQGEAPKLNDQYGSVVVNQVFPLSLRKTGDKDFWRFPYECLLSIKGKNIIVTRNVAKGKGRGSVKEHWTQDDYALNITGVLFSLDGKYPFEEVKQLRAFCEAKEALEVLCPFYKAFDITRLVITDWDIPHTKGENVQAFSISALSDDITELLIDDNIAVL